MGILTWGVGLNMSSPILVLFLCIIGLAAAQNCCATMESGGKTYTLSMERADKPNPDCIDGCVYTMAGENFCFAEQPLTDGASNGTCQATPIDCTCGFRVFSGQLLDSQGQPVSGTIFTGATGFSTTEVGEITMTGDINYPARTQIRLQCPAQKTATTCNANSDNVCAWSLPPVMC